MTIIKTILEGFIMVGLVLLGVYLNTFVTKSKLAFTFAEFDFHATKIAIPLLIIGLLGSYWYLFKNVWIGFKSKTVIYIFICFCVLTIGSSLFIVNWGLKLPEAINAKFAEIPFPTEPDIVQKNIKMSIIKHASYMLFSFIGMGILGILFGFLNLKKTNLK